MEPFCSDPCWPVRRWTNGNLFYILPIARSSVNEPLHRALGLTDEAKRTAAVLGHNYPGSEWYQDSYSLMLTGKTQDEATKAADPGVFGWGLWIF